MSYLAVNAVVLAVATVIATVLLVRRGGIGRTTLLLAVTFVTVAVFTAVFDSLMIALGLFTYDPAHLAGVYIGLAPIEDFAYVALAALLLPALWLTLPRRAAARAASATPRDDRRSPKEPNT